MLNTGGSTGHSDNMNAGGLDLMGMGTMEVPTLTPTNSAPPQVHNDPEDDFEFGDFAAPKTDTSSFRAYDDQYISIDFSCQKTGNKTAVTATFTSKNLPLSQVSAVYGAPPYIQMEFAALSSGQVSPGQAPSSTQVCHPSFFSFT